MLSIVLTYTYISFYLNSLFVRLHVFAAEKDFMFFKLLAISLVNLSSSLCHASQKNIFHQKCANLRMETPVINFVIRTHSGVPINQHMLQTKTLPPAKKIKPTPLPRGNSFMSFNDYSTILAQHMKSSIATTEPHTDTESDTQDHPKTDDLVMDDEGNSEGQVDAHKGDPKIHESLPPSDTPEDENSSLDGTPSLENNYPY
ncbi:hypothetical protein BDR04DRAFT_1148911 [Suillus decipiens]|nr:hypothetical protein BDR04DRAFT_1148911 [Suillus decipiens]